MHHVKWLAIAASCCLSAAAQTVSITGQWMIDPSPLPELVQLTLHRVDGYHNSTNSSTWPLANLHGLSRAQIEGGGSQVKFEVVREAGTLVCEGYFKGGKGAGAFTFTQNAGFVAEMRSLGYDGLEPDTVFMMAVHDVSPRYVRDMRALGVTIPSTDRLVAMTIHRVTVEYVRSLKDLGYNGMDSDKLVAMRIHGASIEFVRDLKGLGYQPSADQLIAMRIHGASVDFVKKLQDLGYARPSVDQLVAMRIHGVTPEFIQQLRGRGMRNLTIDQLVGMKIHGITE